MEDVRRNETSSNQNKQNRREPGENQQTVPMKKQMLLTLLLGIAAFSTSPVQAAVRVEVPPAPGIPAYARTDIIPHDEEWAAIVFYRDPGCVPDSFNLLDLMDIPAAFECPLTVAAFEIWKHGPAVDAGPILAVLHGLGAVPVWFVSWPDLQEEIKDGVLTIEDLRGVNSLQKGEATFFAERLHPVETSNGNYNVVAHGFLEDGRSFNYEATLKSDNRLTSVNIRFK